MTGKTWLCGPWTGNRTPFESAEVALRQVGIVPCYGPHDLGQMADPDAMARARIGRMMECDAVCLLDGWSSDPAADFEHSIARRVGLKCQALVILLSVSV